MTKNNGIKLLAGSVIGVVILILINSKSNAPLTDASVNPNNFNEAIASQFSDNIRDVSARLLETENKVTHLQEENKTLQQQVQQPKSKGTSVLKEQVDALKEQLHLLTQNQSPSYPMSEEPPKSSGAIKDLDELLVPVLKDDTTTATAPKKAPKKTPFYTIPAGSDFSTVTLLSALIGEVPVEGKLMQPLFPFTALVSPGELMAANGMEVPAEITGMKTIVSLARD